MKKLQLHATVAFFILVLSLCNQLFAQSTITYSENFIQGVSYTSSDNQWINWTNFIGLLSPRTYASVTIKGSNDVLGVSVTDATVATAIANALFTGTPGTWTSGGRVWNVGSCGSGIELSANTTGICRCENAYTVRPQVGNSNWGGVNSSSCGGGSQSMTVIFVSGNDVTHTFNFTGSAQTFTIPSGVTSISIETWGGQGANTSYSGGLGGYAKGDLSVTPGEVLNLYVGGQGGVYSVGDQGSWTAGGWNGGGLGYRYGRGGGGASDIRKGGTALANRVIVAAGGGGASNASQCYGGEGGGYTGSTGLRFNSGDPGFCGQGGTQSAGGAACTNYGSAAAGGPGQGGNGGTSGNADGTGGGGGYYGGGGGDQGGAGGGSSYIGGVTSGSTNAGLKSGDGQISITYQSYTNDQTITYSGSSQTWVIPAGVTSVDIEAWGAQGGADYAGNAGGLGSRMKGTFAVTPGESIGIVTGGQGTNYGGNTSGGGGGGGSFVWHVNNSTEPMIAAGGGGGGWSIGDGSGLTTVSAATPSGGGAGGVNGNGGNTTGGCSGSGGAGWKSGGASSGCNSNGDTGGQSKFDFAGGVGYVSYGGNGGFGGGGGTTYGGGGGGGYSGGGGAANSASRGGGGGSYNAGTNQSNSPGVRAGNGLVVITYTLTTTTIPDSPTISYGINSVDLTATVSPNPGGGSVEFYINGSSVGSAGVSAVTGIATISYESSALAIGTYPIRADFGGYNGNPASTSNPSSNGTLTKTKATITATADNKSRLVGQSNPAFTISYSGFVNDEDISALDELPTASCNANSGSPAGSYPIVPAGGSDNNYSFSFVNGALTVSNPGFNWEGGISTNWSTAGNWSTNLVPTAGNNVNIPGGMSMWPHITSDPSSPSVCNALTIASGANLTIDAGKALTVNGTLSNSAGTGGLIIESGGSLINSSTGINATVKRQIAGGEWHLISAPVTDAVSIIFDGKYLQKHTESTNAYTDITSTTEALTPMKGFALWGDASGFSAVYSGPLNAGAKSFSTTFLYAGSNPANNKGWNLVGNPYPSAIDWNAGSGWTKTAVNNALYMHVNASSWASYVGGTGTNGGTQYIAPGQGFFVRASGAGLLAMNDAVRVHHTTTFLKNSAEIVNNLVRIEVSGNNYRDEAVVRILSDATAEFDSEYDADKLFGDVSDAAQIYTLGSMPLSVNTIPEKNDVHVGVKCGISGNYTIAATEINDIDNVSLEDSKTGIFTDLTKYTYSFVSDSGDYKQRFILHFNTLSVDEKDYSFAGIYSYNNSVIIELNGNTHADVNIYNISGQLISSLHSAQGLQKIDLANTGNYIVKLISDKSIMVKKVWIK
jgi:hypothetical protein